jgi:hypothetical protein
MKSARKKVNVAIAAVKNPKSWEEPSEGKRICGLSFGIAQTARGAADRIKQESLARAVSTSSCGPPHIK